MCGIAGHFGGLRSGDEQAVIRAATRMRHRGPDGDGVWHWQPENGGGGVVLAHRRLSIIDLREVAGQPFVDKRTGSAIVYNGEIYNFRELRSELEQEGDRFTTCGDTEVVLRGCLRHGAAFLSRLRGMFALALADLERRVMLLARDGYGIKPLYYHAGEDNRFCFASEVRALLDSGAVARRLDAAAVARYIWNGFVTGPDTLVRSIKEFPRGHYLESPIGEVQLGFRSIQSGPVPAPHCDRNDARQAVEQSVAAHLVADVPLGLFLSGGIDSSAIAVLASASTSHLRTISVGFDIAESDETAFAESVASAIGANHKTVTITGQEMLRDMDEAIAALDQPSFDGVNSWFVSRVAARAGLKVALSGAGGDELFGGYTSFRRIPRIRQISLATSWLSSVLASRLFDIESVRYSSLGKLRQIPSARGQIEYLYQIQYAMFPASGIDGLLAGAGRQADSWGLDQSRLSALKSDLNGVSSLRGVTLLESELFLGDRLLRDTDCMSMAHSIEVRVPLVDSFLSSSLASMTDLDRYGEPGSKPILRHIAEARCGVDVFRRPKRGFEFPFDAWIRGPLRETIETVLLDESHASRCGLNPEGLRAVWVRFIGSPGKIYWTRIWSLYVFLSWCKRNGMELE